MIAAAQAWAGGKAVQDAPPSLRVLMLSRVMRGPVLDVLAADYTLMRELECYAEAEARQERRRAAAQQREQARRGKGRRGRAGR